MTASPTDGAVRRVLDGRRLDAAGALALYTDLPTHRLGQLADAARAARHPDRIVTYIIDRNVNYTNVCVARCNFCAFYREVGAEDGYVLGFDEIFCSADASAPILERRGWEAFAATESLRGTISIYRLGGLLEQSCT